MTNGQHIPEEDLALYAMRALAPAEQASLRSHLEGCAECRQSLARVTEELSLVALSVDQQPLPEGSRQRFLARMASEPQIAAGTAQPAPGRVPPTVATMPPPRRRSIFPILLPWAVAAAAVLFAFHLHVVNTNLQRQSHSDQQQMADLMIRAERAQTIIEAMTSPEAQRVTLTEGKGTPQPTGHATYLPSKGALVFIGDHLRKLPANKTYELWVIPANGKAPIPAGLFQPDANGSASVVLPQLPQDVPAKAIGVTIENSAGSQTPTLPIVLAGQ